MNYIGSKYSLLGFIHETIAKVTGFQFPYSLSASGTRSNRVFVDLFAGTGVVGASFKEAGWKVVSNDIQYYSYVLLRHLIGNSDFADLGSLATPAPIAAPDIIGQYLDRLNALEGVEGFVFQNYCLGSGSGRNYFTDENGKRCDAVRLEIERMYQAREIGEDVYFYLLASLIDSIDKYANTASVYGAYLKHTKKTAQKAFRLELLPVVGGVRGDVYNEDVQALIRKISGDVLYLDPPYNARQYSTNYHVLETIARYDNPVVYGKTGLRKSSRAGLKSNFCSKKRVEQALEDVLANANFPYVFLSYNNEGLLPFETIERLMSRFGEYRCFETTYRRFKADRDENRSIRSTKTTEYLHCLIVK